MYTRQCRKQNSRKEEFQESQGIFHYDLRENLHNFHKCAITPTHTTSYFRFSVFSRIPLLPSFQNFADTIPENRNLVDARECIIHSRIFTRRDSNISRIREDPSSLRRDVTKIPEHVTSNSSTNSDHTRIRLSIKEKESSVKRVSHARVRFPRVRISRKALIPLTSYIRIPRHVIRRLANSVIDTM